MPDADKDAGHNHLTRDIKPRGACPACDAIHDELYALGRDGGCPTEGCRGDVRYAAPGRGHLEDCPHPGRITSPGVDS